MGHLPSMLSMSLVVITLCLNFYLTYSNSIPINKYIYNNNGLGTYSFEFETGNGIYRQEEGGLRPGSGAVVVRGFYSYLDPTGQLHSVTYIADENGFQPLHGGDTRFNDRRLVYEDVELRRIFPREFPQDTIRRTGSVDPEQLGRYNELKRYFKFPKSQLNSHFEELECYEEQGRKLCRIDLDRYSPEEDAYYLSQVDESYVDRRRIYCILLLCFTEDELDRTVSSF